jgi:hypothetical protein
MRIEQINIMNAKMNVGILALAIANALVRNGEKKVCEIGEFICSENEEYLEDGGVWIWEYATGEVFYSTDFCKSIGYEYGELGRGFGGFDKGDKQHMDRGMKMIEELIAKGSSEPFINQIDFTTKNNTILPVQCIGAVLYKSNKPQYILGTHRIM